MRGSKLQFTEWLLGLVIEVGMNTYIYRKFKRPKIQNSTSTFMRKQFLYSVICLLCLGVAIIITSALMEVNTCLNDGFHLEDAKFVIAALL